MDNRWFLPISLAAVLAVGVAAGLVGGAGSTPRAIGGTPRAADVRPEPEVGDCLMGGPDGPFPYDDATGESYLAPYAGWFGDCDGVRYGEVTAVLEGQADGLQDDGTVSVPLQTACDTALSEYLGAPDPSRISEVWWLSYADGSTALTPDPRQAASGQDWAACIIRPPYWGPGGREGQTGPDGYTSVGADSIRGVWNDIEVRDRLGSCFTSDGSVELRVYCGEAHDAESLAWTTWTEESAAADWLPDVTLSCQETAAKIIGRDDPTFGGRIAIRPVVLDADGKSIAVTAQTSVSAGDQLDCEARPTDQDQVLTSTLAWLGDADVPLASR